MIKAEVIADSKNEFGDRVTTMLVTMPRRILAEFNTHRMFSRNSASSRAIPFEKMVESVKTNPFIPMAWMRNHKGMQGTEYLSKRDVEGCRSAYLVARDMAVRQAEHMFERGLTKQECNRLLEPYMWHTCIVTSTEWENFFALRCPRYEIVVGISDTPNEKGEYGTVHKSFRSWKDVCKENENFLGDPLPQKLACNKGQAEIHMMALAEAMWDAYNESTPVQLEAGEWHIPFGDKFDPDQLMDCIMNNVSDEERAKDDLSTTRALFRVRLATALCAGVSYTIVGEDGKAESYEKLIRRHDKLAKDGHWSPFEHCARAMDANEFISNIKGDLKILNGWDVHDFASGETSLIEKYVDRDNQEIGWSGNFRGFIQYRKMLPNENITK